MSGVIVMRKPDVVSLVVDTVASRNGQIVGHVAKSLTSPHARFAVAWRGMTDHLLQIGARLGLVDCIEAAVMDSCVFVKEGGPLEIYLAGFDIECKSVAFAITTDAGWQEIKEFAIAPKAPDLTSDPLDMMRRMAPFAAPALIGGNVIKTDVYLDRIEQRIIGEV